MAIRIHRQSAEVAGVEAANADLKVRLFRFGVEVLGGEPTIVEPVTLPANLSLFLQNWSRQVTVDTLWSTDVQASASTVAEERRGLLSKPQRNVGIRWTAINPGELDEVVPHLKRLARENVAVPLYSDQAELTTSIGGVPSTTLFCDTTDKRFYPGAFICIAKLDFNGHATGEYLVRTISEKFPDRLELTTGVSSVTAKRALIFPLLNVEVILRPTISYKTGHVAQIDLLFQETYGPNSLGPLESGLPGGFGVYQGLPIWDFEPAWSRDIEVAFQQEGRQYKQGLWQQTDLEGARARYGIDYPFFFERPDALRFMRFFDTRRGRLLPLWHVDQEEIWTIASQSNSDTELNITAIGSFDLFQDELDYIGVVMLDGTVHVREVTDIDDETSTWEVTMESALPSLDLTQVRRVARARKVRFAEDSQTETWRTTNVCLMDASLIELLDEDEVTL